MDESKAAWDQVADRFTELGQRIKQQFEARTAFAQEDRAKVDDALQKLADAVDTAFTAIGDTMRDPGIKDQLKETANTLASAVSTTFQQVADEVKARFGREDGPSATG